MFGLASVLLVGAIGYGALQVIEPRLVAHDMAEAQRQVQYVATRIAEPAVDAGILDGDTSSIAAFDRRIREQVMRPGVVQVKLWSRDGTLLYSDAGELIGRRFELEPAQRALLRAGDGTTAKSRELERDEHSAVPLGTNITEISAVIDGPDGQHLLWETYLQRGAVVEQAESLLVSLGVTGAIAASLVLAAQVALALLLTRQVMRSREQRIDLLRRAASATIVERRRIASDLHDGVVQDLHGLALDLHGLASDLDAAETILPGGDGAAPSSRATDLAARLRHSLRDLRTLAADIHPPDLHAIGLSGALERLLRTCDDRLEVRLAVDGDADLDSETRALLFRAAQEAVRNVLTHAHATHLVLEVRTGSGQASLTVTDDGQGLGDKTGDGAEHLGLALVAEMAEAAGGHLTLHSASGSGTTVYVEVPA